MWAGSTHGGSCFDGGTAAAPRPDAHAAPGVEKTPCSRLQAVFFRLKQRFSPVHHPPATVADVARRRHPTATRRPKTTPRVDRLKIGGSVARNRPGGRCTEAGILCATGTPRPACGRRDWLNVDCRRNGLGKRLRIPAIPALTVAGFLVGEVAGCRGFGVLV